VPVVLVTGASRGIGLEFARQYAAAGWRVIACCRNPGSAPELASLAAAADIRIAPLDVRDGDSVARLAESHAREAIDVLINNAGIMGALPFGENLQRQHLGSIDFDLWREVMDTNTLGTVRVTEALTESVANSELRRIVTLSSATGSIAESRREALAYTSSKAALNKAMTLIAEKLRSRGIIVSLLCPGYVKTRMNVGGATVEPADSVTAMRKLIAAQTLADSGSFRRYNGESIAW